MGYAIGNLEYQSKLEITTCCACGTVFGIEERLMANLRQHGAGFFCPNGHPLTFGKTAFDRLKEQNERLIKTDGQRLIELATERQQRISAETKMNRFKKRVGNGVCPCCKRSFGNLQKHMECKHPDFKTPAPSPIK